MKKERLVLIRLDRRSLSIPKFKKRWFEVNSVQAFEKLENGLKYIFETTGNRNFRIEENEVYLIND